MLKRLLRLLISVCALASVLLIGTTCTTIPELPAGVVKQSSQVECGKDSVAVDLYFQRRVAPQPLVVVVHGFSRSKRYMAGWGADLASHGMIVAVMTQPYWAGHSRNAEAIARLVELGRAGKWPIDVRGNGKVGLVGFSMGGLTTLLAAASLSPPVDAWVGLDPVDHAGSGAAKAELVKAPGLALLAEPSPFNAQGNARTMLHDYGGPIQVIKVTGATHCDAESPSDILGQLACGRVDPMRHDRFRATTLEFLDGVFSGGVRRQVRAGDGLEMVRGK
jgi:dienelactone hydrolase